MRWFQFSAFCPLFRSHGRAWKLRLPWGWNLGTPGPLEGSEALGDWPLQQDLHNAQVEPICRKYLELRYEMLPYIYSAVEQTHRTGMPLMRALWFAWPQDEKATLIADQYLWGDHFLVAPVLEPGATRRRIYLPAGAWWDFWSNQKTDGGAEIACDSGSLHDSALCARRSHRPDGTCAAIRNGDERGADYATCVSGRRWKIQLVPR